MIYQKLKSTLDHARGSTPKRLTSGGVHLRDLASARVTQLQRNVAAIMRFWQNWVQFVLMGSKIKPQTSRTDKDVFNDYSNQLGLMMHHTVIFNSLSVKMGASSLHSITTNWQIARGPRGSNPANFFIACQQISVAMILLQRTKMLPKHFFDSYPTKKTLDLPMHLRSPKIGY